MLVIMSISCGALADAMPRTCQAEMKPGRLGSISVAETGGSSGHLDLRAPVPALLHFEVPSTQ